MKRLEIRAFRGLNAKIRCVKIVKISVRGNKSKRLILNVTERFRCQCLTSGQDRCQEFASGRFRCFWILPRLCGQIGCRRCFKVNKSKLGLTKLISLTIIKLT